MNQAILRMGRVVSTLVAIGVGLVVLADILLTQWQGVPFGLDWLQPAISQVGALLVSWTAIVIAFALFLGFTNVVSVHWHRVQARQPGAVYSLVLLVAMVGTLLIGTLPPVPEAWVTLQDIFDYILQPLEATFFALLAVFIVTAAFRAFRVRNMETFFFVLFALIVLLGQVPIGIYLWSEFPIIKDWILNVPTLAGIRGILLGVALGTIATGLRVLIGADRPYSD